MCWIKAKWDTAMLPPPGSTTQLRESQGCPSWNKILPKLGTVTDERLVHLVVQPPPEAAGRCWQREGAPGKELALTLLPNLPWVLLPGFGPSSPSLPEHHEPCNWWDCGTSCLGWETVVTALKTRCFGADRSSPHGASESANIIYQIPQRSK